MTRWNDGVAELSAVSPDITDETNASSGTAALYKVVDRDGTEVFRGSVGTSGADINLDSVDFASGDTVSLSSFTYSASA